jgi:hypothetical protein
MGSFTDALILKVHTGALAERPFEAPRLPVHLLCRAVQRKTSSRLWAVNARSHQCSRVSASAVSIR